tara:strand:- start:1183 stop:1635 length:453 start_codon:yes stop_codon:yes gene_type:complete
MALAKIQVGLQDCLYLGNLNSKRDWGHAKDYVEMQWRMLQRDTPKDYVIATGRQESVRRFIELSASFLGWGGIIWEGEGIKEIGRRSDNGQIVIRVDTNYFRPSEVDTLLGDAEQAEIDLGWKSSTNLEDLVEEMIINDVNEAKNLLKLI